MDYITALSPAGQTFAFKSGAKTPPRAAVIQTDSRTGQEVLFSKASSFANATKTANRFASMHAKACPETFMRYAIVAVHPAPALVKAAPAPVKAAPDPAMTPEQIATLRARVDHLKADRASARRRGDDLTADMNNGEIDGIRYVAELLGVKL